MRKQLQKLRPVVFENLTFDLLQAVGLVNLRWRTPGSDVGRDLQGEFTIQDIAGESTSQIWYVECKRYSKSIDWPTVHQKIAYAANHNADFLLFVTTASFSPQCMDEVQKHNQQRKLQVRIWPYFELESLLSLHRSVAQKYGLMTPNVAADAPLLSSQIELTKLLQSIYGRQLLRLSTEKALEAAVTFSELLNQRAGDIDRYGKYTIQQTKSLDDFESWSRVTGKISRSFDRFGIRALLAATRNLESLSEIVVNFQENETVRIGVRVVESNELVKLICFFGFLEIRQTRRYMEVRSSWGN
jgi:hypothetical protein